MKRVKSPRKGQAQSSTDVLQNIFSSFYKNRTPLYCFRMNFTNFRENFFKGHFRKIQTCQLSRCHQDFPDLMEKIINLQSKRLLSVF